MFGSDDKPICRSSGPWCSPVPFGGPMVLLSLVLVSCGGAAVLTGLIFGALLIGMILLHGPKDTNMIRSAALFALLICAGPPAAAQTDLRPGDAARLDRFEETAGRGLLQALAGGAPDDVAALTKALSGTSQVAFDETLAGDWSCRTMKLGGPAALVVYASFKCRFTIRQDGFFFEKLTGSERTRGMITFREGRAVYVGVGHVADEAPVDYADLPDDFKSDGRIQTDVAVFERASPTRARLMFAAPAVESDFDILELTR